MIKLVDVYKEPRAKDYLYNLLEERKAYESISHNTLPTWQEHLDFIARIPYKAWYIIMNESGIEDIGEPVGSIYLSYNNEIGIGIFENERRHGYATDAIKLLMEMHPEKFYLANINPANLKSINLFNKLGFKHIQNTYKLGTK